MKSKKQKMTVDNLVKAMVIAKQKMTEIQKKADKEIAKHKDMYEQIEKHIAKMMIQDELTSIKTESGVISLSPQEKFNCTDWHSVWEFSKKADQNFCQLRLHNGNLQEYFKENPDVLYPKGLEKIQINKLRLTKAKK